MDTLSSSETNRKTVLAFLAGTHSGNIDDVSVIDETVSDDIVGHGFPGMRIHGRESYKEFFRVFRRSFADMDWKIHAMVADEQQVAVRWQIRVTHVGPFAGVPATDRRVCVDGMVLYRMEDGLIAETWLHLDEMKLLSAIGAIDATGPSAE